MPWETESARVFYAFVDNAVAKQTIAFQVLLTAMQKLNDSMSDLQTTIRKLEQQSP